MGLFVSSNLQRFECLAAGNFTEFSLPRHLDLADAFLADPQLLADLCQRQLGGAAESVSAYDDPPLTLFELAEPVFDCRSPLFLGLFALVLVGVGVARRDGLLVESELVTAETVESPFVVHQHVPDRPGGIGAEPIAPSEIEPIHGVDEARLPSLTHSDKS